MKFRGVQPPGYFIILDEDDDVIALDQPSGGYPYKAYGLADAGLWKSFEEAARYIAVIKSTNPDHGWKIVPLDYHPLHTIMPRVNVNHMRRVWNERNGEK